jgi:signal transduction histidine kinase
VAAHCGGAAVVVVTYVVSLVPGAWDHDIVAVGVLLLVVVAAVVRAAGRRTGTSGRAALIATSVVALAVWAGTVARATVPSGMAVSPALLGYDAALAAAAVLLVRAVRAPGRARLTDVVVELGTARLPDVSHVAEAVGADPALRSDAALEASLATARDLESGNARLRATVRSAVRDLEASRRRLVVAEDEERGRLSDRLGASAVQPLQVLIAEARAAGVPHESLLRALRSLEAAVAGLRPPELDDGLAAAIQGAPPHGGPRRAARPRRGAVRRDDGGGALRGVLGGPRQHRQARGASQVSVVHTVRVGRAELVVTDDGVGSAGQGGGSGLTGLADRVAALGGTLTVEPVAGPAGAGGTQVRASVPVGGSAAGPRLPLAAHTVRGGGTAPGGDRP